MYLEARMDKMFSELTELRKEIKALLERLSDSKQEESRYFSSDDACRYIGCSKRWLQLQTSSGKLRRYKVGGKLFFSVEDLDNLIRNQ